MTTLITGGNSRIGGIVANLLAKDGLPVLFASRSGKVPDGFKFAKMDWYDPSTFEEPFKVDADIKTVYILGPDLDLLVDKVANPFIDIALAHGVEKFVVLTATTPMIGQVLLEEHMEHRKAKFILIRPNWFMENFVTIFGQSIKVDNEIVSSVPTGSRPLVAVSDIAQAAYEAIVDKNYPFKDKYVIGPDNWTYDEAAKVLSEELGRTITHRAIPHNEVVLRYTAFGVPEDYARMLIGLDVNIEHGGDEKYIKQAPFDKRFHVGTVTLRDWIKANKSSLG